MPVNTSQPYQDPRKGLDRLKGINVLQESERRNIESQLVNAGLLPNKHSSGQLDRLYRDIQYINEFGIDDYTTNSDVNVRDKKYRDTIIGNTAKDVFANSSYGDKSIIFGDERVGYAGLDSDSLLELMESGYKNTEELEALRKDIDKRKEEHNKSKRNWKDVLSQTGNPYIDAKNEEQIKSDSQERALESIYSNALQINKDALEKAQLHTAERREAEAAPDALKLTQYIKSKADNWKEADQMQKDIYSGKTTTEALIKYLQDSGMVTKEWADGVSKLDVESQLNILGQYLQESEFNPAQIDNLFDKVGLSQEIRDEVTGEVIGELPGSSIYQSGKRSLRNKSTIENGKEVSGGNYSAIKRGLTASDKLYQWAMWQVIAQKYGVGTAISQLDANLAKISQNNEDLWDHTTDIVINIGFGGLANIMNKVNGVLNLAATVKGEDALQNRLQGKTIEGEDRILRNSIAIDDDDNWLKRNAKRAVSLIPETTWFWDNAFNPQYWSKVDEYNTLDPFEMNRIEALNGISPYTTTTVPGEDIKFFSRKSLDEALKMGKFLWSDYLTGQIISAPFMWGAQKAGQITKLGKTLGKVGSAAAVLGSAVGISESYGMMTFDSAYEEAMSSLVMKQNEAMDKYINEQLSNEEVIAEIDKKVRDISFKQAMYGEGKANVDAIRQQVISDYKDQLGNQWLLLNKESIEKDEETALNAATEAYMVDATIEQIRMSGINALFRKYLFTPQVRRYLGDANKFSKSFTTNTAGETVTKKGFLPYAKNMGKLVFSGFESNYFDDVTVGFGKGFGLGKYNAYLEEKYNGEGTAEAADYAYNFISGLSGAVDSAGEALLDKQSFYDGFIGGIGVPFSAMPRLGKSERADARKNLGLKQGEKVKGIGQWLYLNIKNSLLDAYYETKAGIKNTEEVLPLVKKVLKDKSDALQDIEAVISSAEKITRALKSGAAKDIMDAKDNEAYQLVNLLYGAKYSPIIDEFEEVKDFLGNIERLSKGNISEDMITSFLARPENSGMLREDAKFRIQQNAKNLKKMAKTITDAHSIIDGLEDVGDEMDKAEREQLVYMLAMEDAWKERVNDMENQINHRTLFSESGSLRDRIEHYITRNKITSNPIAKYGNKEALESKILGYNTYAEQLSEKIISIKNKIDKTSKQLKEANKFRSKEDEEAIKILSNDLLSYQLQLNKLLSEKSEVKAELKEAVKARKIFESENVPILSREEILNLNPIDRENMLRHPNKYSSEQKAIIEQLNEDNEANIGKGYWSIITDEARLYKQIEDNRKAFNRLARNPGAALAYVNNLKAQRYVVAQQANYYYNLRKIYQELDAIKDKEELFSKVKSKLVEKGTVLNAASLKSYIDSNGSWAEELKPLLEVANLREYLNSSIDVVFQDTDDNTYGQFRKAVKASFAEEIMDANSGDEAMLRLEELLDKQVDERIKSAYSRILDGASEIGIQRSATMQRNREEEKKRKEEEAKRTAEEKAKLDGKNYKWEGFKVGTPVYDLNGNYLGTVSAFKVEDNMLVERKLADGTTQTMWLKSSESKDKVTNKKENKKEEKPKEPEKQQEERKEIEAKEPVIEQVKAEDFELFEVDENGATESPSPVEEARATGRNSVTFTDSDAEIDTSIDPQESLPTVMPGNRYQQYSYTSLKEGIVKEEIPVSRDSIFFEFIEWINSNNIRLQDIIDKEFAKVILEKPDTKIRFMMLPTRGKNPKSGTMESLLINVIEFDDTAKKYHIDKNGGVITDAEGKQWLVVGTTGFANNATKEQRNASDRMKLPISNRRVKYFEKHPEAKVYIDKVAYTTVKHFTSGNIVKQTMDMDSMSLRPLSELMKASGKTLENAELLIQKREANGTRGAVVSKGVDITKVHPPKDTEGNVGRTFILIDTPNGEKIPGYIEAEMFNNLADGSPLKNSILKLLNEKILNVNYEVRNEGIKRLCGYLVLKKDGKNLLIGSKDSSSNTITITVPEKRPSGEVVKTVKFDLNKFDIEERNRFFDAFTKANFEVNVSTMVMDDIDILREYDESGALMTNVASLETVGSTYTVLPVDENGKPIENVKQGNKWSSGNITWASKVVNRVRVNNVGYEYNPKTDSFISYTKEVVTKQSNPKLWGSLYVNYLINETKRSPILTRGLDSYYKLYSEKEQREIIVMVDNLGNTKFLSEEEEAKINKELAELQKLEDIEALRNRFQDIDLGEEKKPEEQFDTEKQLKELQEKIVGEPIKKEVEEKSEQPPETKAEVKEKGNTPISEATDSSLNSLVNSSESGTFTLEDIMTDIENPRFEEFYDALVGTNMPGIEDMTSDQITEALKLPKVFKDVNQIIDILKNCR